MTAPAPATAPLFVPPYSAPQDAAAHLRQSGFALLGGADLARWIGAVPGQLQALAQTWNDLPPDDYLRDGGRYRSRRHGCFDMQAGAWAPVAHRAHWQPLEYNALHGGIERWFAPITAPTLAQPVWGALLVRLCTLCDAVFAPGGEPQRWFVEAHQFRIDTASGIGRPTPEGAHRDGVDLVAVFLVARQGIKGAETRIFEAASPAGQRFTLTEPWSVLLLDDARMVHETTPIQPLAAAAPSAQAGYRDTLVLTWRRGGFQGPVPGPV
ncbi:MAG: 2OG-Fe dioxygenase family protein [Burkholderiaceae bacterium]|nr:2OG-Fe dioxygenase family protein [Burkholderiaceae bacterium]